MNFLHTNSSNIGLNNTAYTYMIGVLVVDKIGLSLGITNPVTYVMILNPINEIQNE